MDANRISIQKLNNSNYSSWRFKTELLLVREDLWRFVDPGVKPNQESDATWNAGDAKARATIGLLVEDNQHGLIRSSVTAQQAWLALQNHHQKTSLTSKVSLLKRICDKRYTEGSDMAEHLFAMEELFSQLANAGQPLAENLCVAMILRSLPSSFDTLTTALESRSDADLTLELVKRKLLDETAKHQGPDQDSVLKVVHDKKRKPLLCHYCKKPGHKQKVCRQLARDSQTDVKSKVKPQQKKESTVSFAFVSSDGGASVRPSPWVVDSGATRHTVADREFFDDLRRSEVKCVKLADGKLAKVVGEGPGVISCCDENGRRTEMKIGTALYSPDLTMNLLSVPALTQKRATVIFDAEGCKIMQGDATVAVGMLKEGLYQLTQPCEAVMAAGSHHNKDCKHVWHKRFGHRDVNAIIRMEKENLVSGLHIYDCGVDEPCECCMQSKSCRAPFPKESLTHTKGVLDLVHTDVCGPVEVPSVSGYRYFMTIIDDYSRFCVLYLLKRKSEVAEKIVEYVALVKTLFGRKPKAVRSDQGGEYVGNKLRAFYRREGIQVQYTARYSPQQNGVAERKNRYLVEMVRCLLFDANLHQCYWAEALNTAVHLQNISPTKSTKLTPYELWHGTKPDVQNLKVFGSRAWVHVPKELRKKLSATAKELVFVGYSSEHKAYRFLDKSTRKVIVSRDVKFIEAESGFPTEDSVKETCKQFLKDASSDDTEEIIIELDSVKKKNFNETEPLSQDETLEEEEVFYGFDEDGTMLQGIDERTVELEGGMQQSLDVTAILENAVSEPRTFEDALLSPERDAWQTAMQEEIDSLKENHTWELVDLPPGRKVVGCKWTYKKKEDANGKPVRYKARLVAQGYSQRYGTDFDEVFAPVARQATLRTLLTVASRDSMIVKHLDIKSAYLYAELEEDIFMRQPPGFQSGNNKVCRLKKCLYGLKQSARVWNKKIDMFFKSIGFLPGSADSCLYVREKNGKHCFIVVYVDDMVIFCNSEEEFNEIRTLLEKHFKLSSLGDLRQFLGIRVDKVNGHYTMDQKGYIEKLVRRFGFEDAKPSKVPLDPAYVKQKEETLLPTNDSYRSLVGSLLYVAVNSRPDICVSTSLLGRKVSNPSNRDWTEAKRVLRYLKATQNLRLHLGSGTESLECFVDADWAGNEGDRKSNSGFIIKYGGGLISWGTRKQSCVALSSTEAEFVALSEGCQELIWLKKLLADLQEERKDPTIVWEDNQSAIRMVQSDRIEKRSKHIDTRHAFTKDLRQKGVIDIRYLPTSQMEADIMTKPLERIKLEQHREALGVK